MTRPPFRRVLFGAVALLALAATTVACGRTPTTTRPRARRTAAASPAIKAPDSITIAYQAIPNGDLIVKQQKLLEKALPDTKITWKLFDSGGSVNEAFASGDIDFGARRRPARSPEASRRGCRTRSCGSTTSSATPRPWP